MSGGETLSPGIGTLGCQQQVAQGQDTRNGEGDSWGLIPQRRPVAQITVFIQISMNVGWLRLALTAPGSLS